MKTLPRFFINNEIFMGNHHKASIINKKNIFIIIFFIIFLSLFTYGQVEAPTKFDNSYQGQSLSINELPVINKSHPRLLIRNEYWRDGPNLPDLKKWAEEEPLNSYLKKKPWNPRPGIEWAFRYLLTKDENIVPPVVKEMKQKPYYYPGYLTELAILYDWLYNSPNFSEQDKKIIEEKLVSWAEQAVIAGQQACDMWSHFGYRPPVDSGCRWLSFVWS